VNLEEVAAQKRIEELGITKTSNNLNLNEEALAFRLAMFNDANSTKLSA